MYSSAYSRKNKRKMNTIESIIPYLYDIAITTGIISVCYALWIQGRHYGENLIMEENPIKITIENYCGQIVTFTMSSEAEIESSLCIEDSVVTEAHINAYDKDILIEKEDII